MRGEVKLSLDGGGGLPAERAGGIGTSENVLEGGDSTWLVMPNPACSCVAAAVVDDVLSGWVTVGVVGDGMGRSLLDKDAAGLRVEAFSESPRAGRSTL